MRKTKENESPTATPQAGGPLVRAWGAVALIPVFLVLALIVGQLLYSLMGYLPENTVPLWVDLVVSAGALLVFLIPCAAAVLYGARARERGIGRGVVPLVIGAGAGGAFLVLTVVTVASTPHS